MPAFEAPNAVNASRSGAAFAFSARDNFVLNATMTFTPIDAIKAWQTGH